MKLELVLSGAQCPAEWTVFQVDMESHLRHTGWECQDAGLTTAQGEEPPLPGWGGGREDAQKPVLKDEEQEQDAGGGRRAGEFLKTNLTGSGVL